MLYIRIYNTYNTVHVNIGETFNTGKPSGTWRLHSVGLSLNQIVLIYLIYISLSKYP